MQRSARRLCARLLLGNAVGRAALLGEREVGNADGLPPQQVLADDRPGALVFLAAVDGGEHDAGPRG
jgi:hypothetical protein